MCFYTLSRTPKRAEISPQPMKFKDFCARFLYFAVSSTLEPEKGFSGFHAKNDSYSPK